MNGVKKEVKVKTFFSKSVLSIAVLFVFGIMYLGSTDGKTECIWCKGVGEINCAICSDNQNDDEICVFCDGKGKTECSICNGTGIEK